MPRFAVHAIPACQSGRNLLAMTSNVSSYGRQQLARACLVYFEVGQSVIPFGLDDAQTSVMRRLRWLYVASSPQPADLTFIQVKPWLSFSLAPAGAKLWPGSSNGGPSPFTGDPDLERLVC